VGDEKQPNPDESSPEDKQSDVKLIQEPAGEGVAPPLEGKLPTILCLGWNKNGYFNDAV